MSANGLRWCGAMVSCCVGVAVADAPPRVLATTERVAAVQQAAAASDGHHARALAAMRARVAAGAPDGYADHMTDYTWSYLAREAAFLSLVSDDDAERARYAGIAYGAIEEIYSGRIEARAYAGKGLGRAMMSLGIGLPYNWCYAAWNEEQRAFVRGRIVQALDLWPSFEHPNLHHARGSNWAGVCRGGELLLLLGGGFQDERADRLAFLQRELTRHLRAGYGDLGMSQEGLGYMEYPGGFVLPAVLAAADVGQADLLDEARRHAWWRLALYTHAFQGADRKFVQTGVAHGTNYDEGWASLLAGIAPTDALPHLRWWYDRHMGVHRPGASDADRFDGDRAGTIYALLFYPRHVEAEDPTGVLPAAVADDRGFMFFRNRWRDADDVLVSFASDTHHHSHAWDQPEQFALNLMGFDTRFIGGPGKASGKTVADQAAFSALLVDGRYKIPGAVDMTGKTVAFETGPQGGYAIADGGALYRGLGVSSARRHLRVDFDVDGPGAWIVTWDRIAAEAEHTYTWQANLGSDRDDGDIAIEVLRESGRPAFLLKGRTGFSAGWVLHPLDAEVTSGDPLRITTRGTDVDIVVALRVSGGESPPVPAFTGEATGTVLEAGGAVYRIDAARERILREAP